VRRKRRCVVGLLNTVVGVYSGVGGTRLLDTVGGSLARPARTDDTTLTIAVWATEALKITAALLPLPTLRNPVTAGLGIARLLGWIAPATLISYGATLTTAGLLAQADVIRSSASADRRALAWHTYLWDPWFLAWAS